MKIGMILLPLMVGCSGFMTTKYHHNGYQYMPDGTVRQTESSGGGGVATPDGVAVMTQARAEADLMRAEGDATRIDAEANREYTRGLNEYYRAVGFDNRSSEELREVKADVGRTKAAVKKFLGGEGATSGAPAPAAPASPAPAAAKPEPVKSAAAPLTADERKLVRVEVGRIGTANELKSFVDKMLVPNASEEDKRFFTMVKTAVDSTLKLPRVDQTRRVVELRGIILEKLGGEGTKREQGSTSVGPTTAPASPSGTGAGDRFVREVETATSFSELKAAFERAAYAAPEAQKGTFAKVADELGGYVSLPADEQSRELGGMKQKLVEAASSLRSLIN